MKKLLGVICGILFAFIISGVAGAISFTDTQYLYEWLSGSGSFQWEHNTPADFGIPPDEVNFAGLCIKAWGVDGKNDKIEIEGNANWTLNAGRWYLLDFSWTSIDITNVFTASWDPGSDLAVTLAYNENGWCGLDGLELISSTFELDYENNPMPAPEPATMLLIGFGLSFLAVFRGKRVSHGKH